MLAVIYDGGSRTAAAEVGGVTLQVVRDWVLRFSAAGPEGLIDRKAPGQPSRLKARAPTAWPIDGRFRLVTPFSKKQQRVLPNRRAVTPPRATNRKDRVR